MAFVPVVNLLHLTERAMSDTYLRLIPKQPDYVPRAAALPEAFALFCALVPKARNLKYSIYQAPAFVDMGGMFDRVSCPNCKGELDPDWWGGAEQIAWQNHHLDLRVTVPCCKAELSLNDLIYEMPAGYARFVMEACNPDVDRMPASEMLNLERLLGCTLKPIWARY